MRDKESVSNPMASQLPTLHISISHTPIYCSPHPLLTPSTTPSDPWRTPSYRQKTARHLQGLLINRSMSHSIGHNEETASSSATRQHILVSRAASIEVSVLQPFISGIFLEKFLREMHSLTYLCNNNNNKHL